MSQRVPAGRPAKAIGLQRFTPSFPNDTDAFCGDKDELFESLTLIQTGKVRHFPVVLMGLEYWGGLLEWLRGTMIGDGKISDKDMDLILVTDSSEEAVEHVARAYAASQEDARLRAHRRQKRRAVGDPGRRGQ